MLQTFAAHMYEEEGMKKLFIKAKLNLSLFGIGGEVESAPPISDIEIALEKMLDTVQKAGKKVLLAIDEVTNTKEMKIFASSYQIFIRQNYPVFILMTGLFENIRSLQNEDTLTFLYRTPRIELKPLSINAMQIRYKNILNISDESAHEMAIFTKGYPYAFQVLGYLSWNNTPDLETIKYDFDSIMEENVYEKIWSGLSHGDKKILKAIALNGGKMATKDIIAKTSNTSSSYSAYRNRLSKSGIIDTSEYGYAKLTLPRFDVFIKNYTF